MSSVFSKVRAQNNKLTNYSKIQTLKNVDFDNQKIDASTQKIIARNQKKLDEDKEKKEKEKLSQ